MQRFEARKKNLIDTIAQEKAELAVRGNVRSRWLDSVNTVINAHP